jgi:predicted metalloprotease with PDZ domain
MSFFDLRRPSASHSVTLHTMPVLSRRALLRAAAFFVFFVTHLIGHEVAAAPRQRADRRTLEPVAYTIRIPAPATHVAEIDVTVPTDGQASVEMMMPIWSPGFYRVEDYAGRVKAIAARTSDGAPLDIERSRPNRWRVSTGGAPRIVISYQLACEDRSVTTNWVGDDFAVFNGPATFMTPVEPGATSRVHGRRPHLVRLELPSGWTQSMTGLAAAADKQPHHYRAADFDELMDSPILAGPMTVREFRVDGSQHVLASVGPPGEWNADRAVRDLKPIVEETGRFWHGLPFRRYVFLIVFRQGGGGLEHATSTLVTANPTRSGTPDGYRAWLGLMSHEYFHAFNVKRLRPVELGPFDYEQRPQTTSLWLSEGVTSYYGNLMIRRAELSTTEQWLGSLTSAIRQLQRSPGRLQQTLAQSSLDVWTNSLSGINPGTGTVSYYVKGQVVGFLLDARIRRATNGRKSLDDVMRRAYERYAGSRGFTGEEFQATVREVAGIDSTDWFRRVLASTEELDYTEALDWFGLRFAPPAPTPPTPAPASAADSEPAWKLEPRPDATPEQQRRLREWMR